MQNTIKQVERLTTQKTSDTISNALDKIIYGANKGETYDIKLLTLIKKYKLEKAFKINENRGEAFETLITGKKCNNNGVKGISQGDTTLNGVKIEIKMTTPKTKATAQLNGSACAWYVVGMLKKSNFMLKLIHANDLIYSNSKDKNGAPIKKIKQQDNENVGVELSYEYENGKINILDLKEKIKQYTK